MHAALFFQPLFVLPDQISVEMVIHIYCSVCSAYSGVHFLGIWFVKKNNNGDLPPTKYLDSQVSH